MMFISVIVPVYKVEKYIEECIESIINQTYRNFELILVDDGSPDLCPEICERYSKEYEYIRVLHKGNGGLSDARNYGVRNASGDYITFVDSDDWVNTSYLEKLVNLIKNNDADMSVVGFSKFYDLDDLSLLIENTSAEDILMTGEEAAKNVHYQKRLDTHAWGLLVKKDTVLQYPFPVNRYHEDDLTTFNYYLSSNKVAYGVGCYYGYRQRADSIMKGLGKESIDELDAADYIVKQIESNHPELLGAAKSKQFSNYCQVLLKTYTVSGMKDDTYLRIKRVLNQNKKNMFMDKYARKKNRISAFVLLFGTRALLCVDCIIKRIKNENRN